MATFKINLTNPINIALAISALMIIGTLAYGKLAPVSHGQINQVAVNECVSVCQ